MVTDRQLRRSKTIQQRTGRTFHFATRLLPQWVRHPTYVLYAFFRVADEVVDGAADLGPTEQRERLEQLRAEALGQAETDDEVLAAFQEVQTEYDIPEDEIEQFIDAMLADIEKDRYDTYEELETYMRGSASAVGVMMQSIMDVERPEKATSHAVALGEAFQLTNFLRDVREDIRDHDRIYLPKTTRERHGVTEADIESYNLTEGFRAAMADELHRADDLYRDGVAGIQYLPEDCQFAVLFSAVLYAEYHRLIRSREYDTLSSTPELSAPRAAWLYAKTRWHWQWSKDPITVFRKVSAVPDRDTDRVERDHPGGTPQAD